MDLLEDDQPGRNEPEFSVSELSGAIKRVIEGEFGRVRVKGEVGRVLVARSGHVYLDLKDDRAVLGSVIWKGQAAKLAVKPEEGMEVIATGKLTTFPGQSKYQLVIDDIRPAGVGALMAMLEKRKTQLEGEGLFAAERKKPIPYLPEVIGVVTSPQGAVIRDILHRLRERFPRKVLIWPVAVQGEQCAPQVTAAINGFNALTPGGALPRPDLIIVARGGGSIEDLWGFNEESVARAAAASEIPLISAVGHETDTTLIDYVSDKRAPTPTAAAEIAVPVRLELLAGVESYGARMAGAVSSQIDRRGQRLRDLSRALPRPTELHRPATQRLDAALVRFEAALGGLVNRRRLDLERLAAPLRPQLLRARIEQDSRKTAEAGKSLSRALLRQTERGRDRFDAVAGRLSSERLTRETERQTDLLADRLRRLSRAAMQGHERQSERLSRASQMLETLSYQATLERGYAVVWDGEAVVTTAQAAKSADGLELQFKDGRHSLDGRPKKAKPSTPPKTGGTQGSLFED